MALVVKNLPVNVGDIRDGVSIPGLGRSFKVRHGSTPEFLPKGSAWTEKPDRLQSIGSQRVGHN